MQTSERIARVADNFRRLDQLARADTAIHRLDPRAKVLVTLAFVLTVASFEPYAVAALLPLFLFPIVLAAQGDLPSGVVVRNVALAMPFALAVGLFNPVFDREIVVQLGSLSLGAGWLSCLSIVLRAALTLSAALVLLGVTGLAGVCSALEGLGVPRVLVMQLHFLHRYLFVLLDDTARSARALSLRACGRPVGWRTVASLIGVALLRTWQRAEQVHGAMRARGYDGRCRPLAARRFGAREVVFVAGWTACFGLLRFSDATQQVGSLLMQVLA